MKKFVQMVLAATLICGSSVFTACSSDNDDNPSQEQAKKNRKEFILHTRQNLKTLADNLNFRSWEAANTLNLRFNQYVLNNPEFSRVVIASFIQKAMQTIKPVEEGSKLAEMGFTRYGTVDLTNYNYRFTMKDDMTGFDIEEADDFEVILNGWNPTTQQLENGIYKLTLKSGGETCIKSLISPKNFEGLALILLLPTEFQFAISSKMTGTWVDGFKGNFKNRFDTSPDAEYTTLKEDNWGISGTLISLFAAVPQAGMKADNTTLNFSIDHDRVNHKADLALDWEQNGLKMFSLSLKESADGTGGLPALDLSNFTSASSIFDLFAALWDGRSIDEGKLTLLDDLTTTISISDMAKAVEIARASKAARRNYADMKTIDQYTQELNRLIKCEMTCKGVNQTIPMSMVTTKFGVDYWSMPALKFSDENGFVPFTELLDKESIAYGFNIIDHAVEPMQQSVIVVRQLVQFLLTISGQSSQQNG
jgi:hypothetical protein